MAELIAAENCFALTLQQDTPGFDRDKPLVLLTFDDNYVDQTINLILSIDAWHPGEVSFLCLCPRLRQENVDALMGLSQGLRLSCFNHSHLPDSGVWPVCSLFRLFSPWLLEERIHRVLYLDSDILCVGSLEELFRLEVPCIAMCNEVSGNANYSQLEAIRPLIPTEIYCNSGVTILNLDTLRRDYSFGEIYGELGRLRGSLVYVDQDFLNVFFRGRIRLMNGFAYNFQVCELADTAFYSMALKNSRLLHFTWSKPWDYKTGLCMIRLYESYSLYEPMLRKVRRAHRLSILYAPIRLAGRILSPIRRKLRER